MTHFIKFFKCKNIFQFIRPIGAIAGGFSYRSIISFQHADLEKPTDTLKFQDACEKWSHKFLLQQSSTLNVESVSVTLTQTVIALQTCSKSYCSHLNEMVMLLTLNEDGLPTAYTNQEVYERLSELRSTVKTEKSTLIELELLFTYVKRLLDAAAETAFLVGAEYASLQASSRLNNAELQVKDELKVVESNELELLKVEKANIIKVGKIENSGVNIDEEHIKKEINRLDTLEKPLSQDHEVNITVLEEEDKNIEKESFKNYTFSFEDSDGCKITIKSDNDREEGNAQKDNQEKTISSFDETDGCKITVKKEEESYDDSNSLLDQEDGNNSTRDEEQFTYRMPKY